MSRSLIRKNQLDPDVNDLVGQYGSGYFISINNFTSTGQVLQNQINTAVYITGNQTISGLKNFSSRLRVNGTGVLLSGEAAQLPNTILYTTGNQTISGTKNFLIRPNFSGSGLATTGELFRSIAFSGSRRITRTTIEGVIPGGSDVITFLNNLFYPFVPAEISLNPFSLRELGTTFGQVPFVGSITQNSETAINNLQYMSGNTVLSTVLNPSFGSFSSGITLNLTRDNTLRVRVNTNNNESPTTITGSQNVVFEAPSYAGSGSLNLTGNGLTLRNVLSGQSTPSNNGKFLISKPSEIVINFTTNGFYYFVYPSGWGLLSEIKDASLGFNFNINTDFTTNTLLVPLANGVNSPYRWYRNTNQITLSNYGVRYIF
jgi:hypothetical protein